jgi:methionyl-tRNA formyltransferase
MSEPLRLVFMGSDAIGLPLLEWLVGKGSAIARVAAVVTGPDRPSGRGQAVRPNSVKAWADGRGLAVIQPERLDAGVLAELAGLRPDITLVVAFGHILRDDLISIPRFATLNLHASLLPRYRGASPVQAAIASGDSETGMTLMRIVRELDAGPIAAAETVAIAPLDTALEIEARLAEAAVPLVAGALPLLAGGELSFRAQDRAGASYCRRLGKADGVLDFSAPAAVLAARVNGLHPWPCVAVDIAGTPVKVGLADALAGGGSAAPGTAVGSDAHGLLVATGSGTLRLRRLQRPGGRMLGAPEFLRGFPVRAGDVLPSAPMPAFVSESPFRR